MPAKAERRTARIEVRVTVQQKRAFERAARNRGLSVSSFLVDSGHAALDVRKRNVKLPFTLSSEAIRALDEALVNPEPPNAAMRRALRRYRKLVDAGDLSSF